MPQNLERCAAHHSVLRIRLQLNSIVVLLIHIVNEMRGGRCHLGVALVPAFSFTRKLW